MSIVVSTIICVVWTLIAPEKDKNAWARFKNIEVEDGEAVRVLSSHLSCQAYSALRQGTPATHAWPCASACSLSWQLELPGCATAL